MWNCWIWGAEREKNEEKWTEPKGPVLYNKVEQYLHYGIWEQGGWKNQKEYSKK